MKKNNDFKPMRVPPNDPLLEQVVLGALMLDRNAMQEVDNILSEPIFYNSAHATIYRAIQNLYTRSNPIDSLTVMEELRRMGELEAVGGPAYLAGLTMKVASSANLEYHCRILAQMQIQRELIQAAMETERDAHDPGTDAFQALDTAEQRVFSIGQRIIRGKEIDKNRIILEATQSIYDVLDSETGIVGAPTGFPEMDRHTTGFQGGDYIALAGRTSMGKSTVGCEWTLGAASAGFPVDFYTIGDSPARKIARKMILMLAGVPVRNLREKLVTPHDRQRIAEAGETFARLPITIHDTASLGSADISALRSSIRKRVASGSRLVIVDLIQNIQVEGITDTTARVSRASKELKRMTIDFDIPIVVVAQINRTAETRGGAKRPNMSDAKDSGSIEEDADYFVTVYRPEYYGIKEDEQGNSTKGITEIQYHKSRNDGEVPKTFLLKRDPATDRLREGIEETFGEKLHGSENQIINGYNPVISGNGRTDEDIPF